MSDATLTTIYDAVKDLAYTCFSVAPQSTINTYPRIVIQEISEVPAQYINGILALRECQVTVSCYGTDYSALKTLSDSAVDAIQELDQIWLDSVDSSIDDRGTGTTPAVIHRRTCTFTYFSGAQ